MAAAGVGHHRVCGVAWFPGQGVRVVGSARRILPSGGAARGTQVDLRTPPLGEPPRTRIGVSEA